MTGKETTSSPPMVHKKAYLHHALEYVKSEICASHQLDKDRAEKLLACALYSLPVRCEILDRIDFYLDAKSREIRRRDYIGRCVPAAIRLLKAGLLKDGDDLIKIGRDLWAAIEDETLWNAITGGKP